MEIPGQARDEGHRGTAGGIWAWGEGFKADAEGREVRLTSQSVGRWEQLGRCGRPRGRNGKNITNK